MIVPYSELPRIREENADRKVVFRVGCFDLIHEGHVAGLEFCRKLGDLLVVGVSANERVAERKGAHRPYREEAGRIAVVNAFSSVDYAFHMPARSIGLLTPAMQAITSLRPDVYVEEAAQADRWSESRDFFLMIGTELVIDEQPKLDSTSAIVNRVIANATVTSPL